MDQDAKHTSRPVIVLGVERSGTSVVAEMVYRWGAYGGKLEDLTRIDECNAQGYWEYKPLRRFHDELFNAVKFTPWNPPFKQRVMEMAHERPYRELALELVAGMETGGPWFWKDPKLIYFLPFWQEIWRDPVYLITVRHPYETALSWQRFIVPRELQGTVTIVAANLAHWQFMTLSLLEHTQHTTKKLFVPYEALIADPFTQAARIDAFLSRECGTGAGNGETIEAMARTVNPTLWRTRHEIPFAEISDATDEQKAQYEFLRKLVDGPSERFDATEYRMTPGWQEYVINLRLFLNYYAQTSSHAH